MGIDPPDSPTGQANGLDPRFDRQVRFAPLGRDGQRRLARSRVLVVGCGALGGVLAQCLARAGVGELILVDRDVVDLTNLHRQVLFEERHALEGTPKALAAAETLGRVGGPTVLTPHAAHVGPDNLGELARGVDLALDGTDNLATRYLLNDHCVEHGLPWVYAGVVGASGLVLPILPGRGPCLRCVFPEPPPPGSLPTCDTAGVILPGVGAVASLAAGAALRLLADGAEAEEALRPGLCEVDVWNGTLRRIEAPRDPSCPACVRGERAFLDRAGGEAELLCGRGTVQIPGSGGAPDLAALAGRLEGLVAELARRPAFLRFSTEGLRFTVFPDGRALVEGTEDTVRARTLYDRLVGG